MRWSAPGLCCVLLFAEGCCSCCSCGGDSPPPSPAEVAARQALDTENLLRTREGVLAVAGQGDQDAREEKACPDAELQNLGYSERNLLTLDQEFLVRLADPEFDATSDDGVWAWMRTEALQKPSRGPEKYTDDDLSSVRERRFLAVFDADTRTSPVIDGSGNFTPGRFEGWLVVHDLKSQSLICQVRLTADSRLRGDPGAGSIKDRQKAADEDFQEVFESQGQTALSRITDKLDLDLGWTN